MWELPVVTQQWCKAEVLVLKIPRHGNLCKAEVLVLVLKIQVLVHTWTCTSVHVVINKYKSVDFKVEY